MCIYFYLVMDNTSTPPHCTICGEFLGTSLRPALHSYICFYSQFFTGFPCSKCMQHATDNCLQPSAVLHCPLVQVLIFSGPCFEIFTPRRTLTHLLQNAGCGHLHHAHCISKGTAAAMGCPSGCPREKFPREAAGFDLPTPHIIVVWDGDKIDKIPIPAPQGNVARTTLLKLTSDEVIKLIQNFLTGKDFVYPGLSMRIHSRDAITEYAVISRPHY